MSYDPATAFSDELSDAIRDLYQFLLISITYDTPPVSELKEKIKNTMLAINDHHSDLFGVIDIAAERLDGNMSFHHYHEIVDDLMTDLNNVRPLYRVHHSPSDQWSSVDKLTGDGLVETIAYFASPTIAEKSIDFIESMDS